MRCNHGRTVACTCNYLNQPLVRAEQTDLRWPGSHASRCPYVELKHEALELSGMLLLRTAYSDVQYSAYTFFSEAELDPDSCSPSVRMNHVASHEAPNPVPTPRSPASLQKQEHLGTVGLPWSAASPARGNEAHYGEGRLRPSAGPETNSRPKFGPMELPQLHQ